MQENCLPKKWDIIIFNNQIMSLDNTQSNIFIKNELLFSSEFALQGFDKMPFSKIIYLRGSFGKTILFQNNTFEIIDELILEKEKEFLIVLKKVDSVSNIFLLDQNLLPIWTINFGSSLLERTADLILTTKYESKHKYFGAINIKTGKLLYKINVEVISNNKKEKINNIFLLGNDKIYLSLKYGGLILVNIYTGEKINQLSSDAFSFNPRIAAPFKSVYFKVDNLNNILLHPFFKVLKNGAIIKNEIVLDYLESLNCQINSAIPFCYSEMHLIFVALKRELEGDLNIDLNVLIVYNRINKHLSHRIIEMNQNEQRLIKKILCTNQNIFLLDYHNFVHKYPIEQNF